MNWLTSKLIIKTIFLYKFFFSLGILHDGVPFNPNCPSNGYLMSSSRGSEGETNWSVCSAEKMSKINYECLKEKSEFRNENELNDHNKFGMRPGQTWNANDQCKLFTKDKQAYLVNEKLSSICDVTLVCATPNKFGQFHAGPALEGTDCGEKRWCVDGACKVWNNKEKEIL